MPSNENYLSLFTCNIYSLHELVMTTLTSVDKEDHSLKRSVGFVWNLKMCVSSMIIKLHSKWKLGSDMQVFSVEQCLDYSYPTRVIYAMGFFSKFILHQNCFVTSEVHDVVNLFCFYLEYKLMFGRILWDFTTLLFAHDYFD